MAGIKMDFSHHQQVRPSSVCLLCNKQLCQPGNPSGGGAVSAVVLESLLQCVLNVDVYKIPVECPGLMRGNCWTAEDLAAARLCDKCGNIAAAFRNNWKMAPENDNGMWPFIRACIQLLQGRVKLEPPGSTYASEWKYYNFQAEFVKMCELKLKLNPGEGELPDIRQLQSDGDQEERPSRSDVPKGILDGQVGGGDRSKDFEEGQSEADQMEGGRGDDNQNANGTRPRINGNPRKAGEEDTLTFGSRKCPHCGLSLRGPKSFERRHRICCHTSDYLPGHFGEFTQGDIDQVTGEICKQNFVTIAKERKTFMCFSCLAPVTEHDKKMHLLQEHADTVISQLERRRTIANANRNTDGFTAGGGDLTMNNLEDPRPRKGQGDQFNDVEEVRSEDSQQGQSDNFNESQAEDVNQENQLGDFQAPDTARTDDEEEPYTCECGYCDLPFPCISKMIRHMMTNHTTAYFHREGIFVGHTDDDIELVMRVLYRRCYLSDDATKHDTFHCSFCHGAEISDGTDGSKFHMLTKHIEILESGLEFGRTVVANRAAESLPSTS